AERGAGTRTRASRRSRAAARAGTSPRAERRTVAKSAEGTEPAHVIVLFALLGVTENVVRLGYFLESLCRLRVVRVRVGMIALGELAVLLLDLVLRGRCGHAEDCVEVLRLCHERNVKRPAVSDRALPVPLLDHHARRPEQLTVEYVAWLIHPSDEVIVLGT